MLDATYIEINNDTCKYIKDGLTYTAIIKEVTPHHLAVKTNKTGLFLKSSYLDDPPFKLGFNL